ncbi:GTPase IMAP family member 4-like [Lissotriton helveticus]
MSSKRDDVVYRSCDVNGDLTILLIGSPGAGKSATGNSILGEKLFVSKASAKTVTVECEKRACVRDGRRLVVVDTPGFLNSNRPEEVRSDISQCLQLCSPGPHAIVLVLQTGRFTEEERDAVHRVQDLFGAQALKRMVIVFTRKDDLGDKSIQTFVKEAEPTLRKLIAKCGGRYCAFNNRATREENNRQVSELIKIIEQVNGTKLYTSTGKIPRKAINKRMAIGAVLGLAILLVLLGVVVWYLTKKH